MGLRAVVTGRRLTDVAERPGQFRQVAAVAVLGPEHLGEFPYSSHAWPAQANGRLSCPRPVRPQPSVCLYYDISAKPAEVAVYFTDRGIEELGERRGEEQVTLGWLAARLQAFVDLHPDFDVPVDRLATWLARDDDEDNET